MTSDIFLSHFFLPLKFQERWLKICLSHLIDLLYEHYFHFSFHRDCTCWGLDVDVEKKTEKNLYIISCSEVWFQSFQTAQYFHLIFLRARKRVTQNALRNDFNTNFSFVFLFFGSLSFSLSKMFRFFLSHFPYILFYLWNNWLFNRRATTKYLHKNWKCERTRISTRIESCSSMKYTQKKWKKNDYEISVFLATGSPWEKKWKRFLQDRKIITIIIWLFAHSKFDCWLRPKMKKRSY